MLDLNWLNYWDFEVERYSSEWGFIPEFISVNSYFILAILGVVSEGAFSSDHFTVQSWIAVKDIAAIVIMVALIIDWPNTTPNLNVRSEINLFKDLPIFKVELQFGRELAGNVYRASLSCREQQYFGLYIGK